jgi:hypothetical protein
MVVFHQGFGWVFSRWSRTKLGALTVGTLFSKAIIVIDSIALLRDAKVGATIDDWEHLAREDE